MICSAVNFFLRGISCPPLGYTTQRFSLLRVATFKGDRSICFMRRLCLCCFLIAEAT